ncbi:gluconate 2-dehydrogenase subunit 3 family protein [Rhizosaccharibacter radicis]|uniref:Gluconate 2-dehydrogenase subunit 3 family protein n=1 Tax=Rhizosaccharibacter radicis TaxID=2782605 RepID=A0ABT1VWC8_9PROT|nr:gluconate 2-dehydrogenase subunit 3 family protein [Acetobacteraceae bacterium KSS12]
MPDRQPDPVEEGRFPGYDVLRKRSSMSWNDRTREVVDRRLAVERGPRTLSADAFRCLEAVCAQIVPQNQGPSFAPLAAYVDEGLTLGLGPGYRNAELPEAPEAWAKALAALDATAQREHDAVFAALDDAQQKSLLQRMQKGELSGPEWTDVPPKLFFSQHVLTDIVAAWAAHPSAWSRIGFGGPASPRGYVRMGFGMRDSWEAAEAHPGQEAKAARENRRVR